MFKTVTRRVEMLNCQVWRLFPVSLSWRRCPGQVVVVVYSDGVLLGGGDGGARLDPFYLLPRRIRIPWTAQGSVVN